MSADFVPESPEPLPKATREDGLGDQGMRMVDRVVSEELEWIFRDQTRKDFGVDALIELAHGDRRVTGRLIAAQIKCGKSWFSESTADGTGWVYRGELRHLNYWLGHSLPVILILCDPDDNRCYFAHVTAARVGQTSGGWSIVVPRALVLDVSAREQLKRLTRTPQRKDVIEFALLQHLGHRWGDRLRICPILEAPRDFHRFAHLVEIRGEPAEPSVCTSSTRRYDCQRLRRLRRSLSGVPITSARPAAGFKDLMLFVVGDDLESIRFSDDAQELVDRSPNLRLHRLLYDDDRIVSLAEIDSNDRPVEFWPGADEPGL